MLVGLRSRRHIAPFTLHRPATVAAALALRDQTASSAFMAGGMDLIDRLKYGHPIEHVIRLDGIPELAAIGEEAGGLRIGAMVTHDALIRDAMVGTMLPDLAQMWRQVANPRVRFTGTVGGNVMAAQPAYDALPGLLALGAQAEVATPEGRQVMGMDVLADRFIRNHASAPRSASMVTAFLLPDASKQRLYADRTLRPAISVWLAVAHDGGNVRTLRVAVGSAHPIPVSATLHPDIPVTELPGHADELATQLTAALPGPVTDANASAAYRRRMAAVLTRRLLIRAGAFA